MFNSIATWDIRGGKQAGELSESRWSPPSMDTYNSRGVDQWVADLLGGYRTTNGARSGRWRRERSTRAAYAPRPIQSQYGSTTVEKQVVERNLDGNTEYSRRNKLTSSNRKEFQ
ncbi:hypothetical protein EVAR_20279_1 [Eumeta japonica]|uniref:Uncharacterized protein n=1 Tax=Eumeta variegata TaxID=151549 RepID=A0A4C1VLZ2_EUMVA|nr:hypothetical protein EVAR_20279_1 [Eumeta japonica]